MKVKQTVHVIDDDRSLRRSVRTVLHRHGYSTDFFADAEAYFASDACDRAGCLIVELLAPGIEPTWLSRQLRDRHVLTPHVVLTRKADVATAVEAMKEGAIDFFLKPVPEQSLVEAVRRAHRLDAEVRRHHSLEMRVNSVVATLSDKELHVLDGLLQGKSSKVIGSELAVTIKTIEYYRGTLKTKFNVNSIAELIILTLPFRNGKRTGRNGYS